MSLVKHFPILAQTSMGSHHPDPLSTAVRSVCYRAVLNLLQLLQGISFPMHMPLIKTFISYHTQAAAHIQSVFEISIIRLFVSSHFTNSNYFAFQSLPTSAKSSRVLINQAHTQHRPGRSGRVSTAYVPHRGYNRSKTDQPLSID